MNLGITINISQSGAGAQQAVAAMNQLASAANNASTALNNVGSKGGGSIRATAKDIEDGFTSALVKLGLISKALETAKEVYSNIVRTGVEFNAELQRNQLAVAAMITNYQNVTDAAGNQVEGAQKFNLAMGIAVDLQDKLKQRSLETGINFKDLANTAQFILASSHGQVKDLEQLVTLSTRLTKVGQLEGVSGVMLQRDVSSILRGETRTKLAQLILGGTTGAELKQMKEAGTLIDFLNQRLAIFEETANRFRTTVPGAFGALKNAWEQALGEGTKDLTQELVKTMNGLFEAITDVDEQGKRTFNPDFVEAIKALVAPVQELAQFVLMLANGMKEAAGIYHALNDTNAKKDVTRFQQEIDQRRKMLKMGSYTAEEKQGIEDEIKRYQDAINSAAQKIRPPDSINEQFMKQTAGGGTKFEFFPNIADAGEQLRKLAADDVPVYLVALRLVKKASEDGTLTQMEFAKAIANARKEVAAKKPKIGQGDKDEPGPPTERTEAQQLAVERLTERINNHRAAIEALNEQIRIQVDVSKQDVNIAGVRARLDETLSEYGAQRLDILKHTRTIILEIGELEADRAQSAAGRDITAETKRHSQVLSDLNIELAEIEKLSQNKVDKSGKILSPAALTPAKAAELTRAVNDAITREVDTHKDKILAIESLTQDQIKKIAIDTQKQINDNLRAQFEESHKYLIQLYDDLGRSVSNSIAQAFVDVSQGHGLKGALQSLVEGFRGAMANVIGSWVNDVMNRLKTAATGTPDTKTLVPQYDLNGKFVGFGHMTEEGDKPSAAAKYGYAAMQGGVAAYGIYQQAQGQSRTAGTVGGAVSGASAGATFGAAGAIVGAILGAAIGAVASGVAKGSQARFQVTVSPDGHLQVKGFGKASQSDVDAAIASLNQTLDGLRDSAQAVLDAFPTAIARSLRGGEGGPAILKPGFSFGDAIKKVRNFGISFFKRGLEGGFTSDELKHFNDVELPNMVFDAYAPIFQEGLKSLGVTEEKLKELFAKVPGFDPKQALQKIQDFVTVLVGFVDSDTFNRLTGSELMSKARIDIGATPIENIMKMNQGIKDLADGFGDLTNDQQVARGKQILDLEKQRQQAVLQYMLEIKQAQDDLTKGIKQQLFDIGLSGMGDAGKRTALQGRLSDVMGQIGTAKTPQELTALGNEAQQLIGQIFDLTTKLPADLKGLIEGFKGLDDILAPEKGPAEKLRDFSTKIIAASDKLNNATNLDDQIAAAHELLDLSQQRYALEKQMLDEINSSLEAMNKSIDKQIHDFGLEAKITALGPNADPTQVANIRIADLLEQQRNLRDQLGGATTAEEVNRIVSEMQSNASSLFELMGKTPEAAKQLTDMLNDIRQDAQAKFKQFTDQILADNDAIKTRVNTAVDILTTALGKLPDAAKQATDALGQLQIALDDRFAKLTEEVIAANEDILGTIDDILGYLRSGLEGVFGGTGTGGTGTGAGTTRPGFNDGPNFAPTTNNESTVVQMGQPQVFVQISGSAEKLIDTVVARASIGGAQTAVRAMQRQASQRGTF